ncbi:hypothetical protein HDF19_13185 [Mucilaginibacter sp. E4BP6]|uniref:hypothetical protein n=1 Tax=Mucilaginibacter sp. E4BP6 TaxID=2723089 RepID=UPI0015CE815D|nr:hypothetical protein [Mucilaginibacter sp. E4BP6]NYE64869.1 hypothetical protein [Mucilaginibacter sp. E4BP6]
MNPTVITITFTGATGGSVTVFITGTGRAYNYLAGPTTPPDPFNLPPGNYSIQVHGYSGGTVNLSVDQAGTNLVTDSCAGTNIYMLDNFNVV